MPFICFLFLCGWDGLPHVIRCLTDNEWDLRYTTYIHLPRYLNISRTFRIIKDLGHFRMCVECLYSLIMSVYGLGTDRFLFFRYTSWLGYIHTTILGGSWHSMQLITRVSLSQASDVQFVTLNLGFTTAPMNHLYRSKYVQIVRITVSSIRCQQLAI